MHCTEFFVLRTRDSVRFFAIPGGKRCDVDVLPVRRKNDYEYSYCVQLRVWPSYAAAVQSLGTTASNLRIRSRPHRLILVPVRSQLTSLQWLVNESASLHAHERPEWSSKWGGVDRSRAGMPWCGTKACARAVQHVRVGREEKARAQVRESSASARVAPRAIVAYGKPSFSPVFQIGESKRITCGPGHGPGSGPGRESLNAHPTPSAWAMPVHPQQPR